jgi:hypothetical protein
VVDLAMTITENDVVYYIDVDFYNRKHYEVVYAKQYDENARYIVATVWKDGQEYHLPSNAVVHFACTKPDRTGVLNQCEIQNGKIIYRITDQTTIKYGRFKAEFRVYNQVLENNVTINRRLTSPSFFMDIDRSELDDDTVISTDEFNALTDAIANLGDITADVNDAISRADSATSGANTARDSANSAAQTALDAAGDVTASENYALQSQAWAIGVASISGSLTNNSKYYSEQSANSAQLASQYASIVYPNLYIDIATGELVCTGGENIVFTIDASGCLISEITV